MLFDLVPNPVQLNLSNHMLTPAQLEAFLKFKSVQIFRMSFIKHNTQFLLKALTQYKNINLLELNSANITDQTITSFSECFSKRIRHLYIMDNYITDDGLESMFMNMQFSLESLHVSYNNLTSRSIEIINRYSYDIKNLHISKYISIY